MQMVKFKDWRCIPRGYTGIVERLDGEKQWYLNDEHLFRLPPESQPFLLLEEFVDEEGEERIKVLTQKGTEIWPNLPGLKELAENWE
jgi:hypothetical protein